MRLLANVAIIKLTETLAYDTHLRVHGKSYPMNTNRAGLRWFSKVLVSLCLDDSLSGLEG